MSKTHYGYSSYDPYGEDTPDQYACGTYVGFDYSVSPIKEDITCKRCLNKFDLFVEVDKENFEIQCDQMGEMADFFIEEEKKKYNL